MLLQGYIYTKTPKAHYEINIVVRAARHKSNLKQSQAVH